MINSKQRAALRAMANSLDTIFQVGKGGISEEMCRQIDAALEARELIKLRVLDNCPYSSKEAASEIAEAVGADVVAVIGSRFVLYKKSTENPKIEI